ncbi:lactonase family protein [Lewinella sp. IMCC34183]|uniref:lactonase family protein n=1 Tax=Lewinella sp. IMCC34183 TaxID=2248762 RepID=UPI000E21FA12|nr:beta-propeller fold lactonase family protein [Lewinella sp. IMCC34183]
MLLLVGGYTIKMEENVPGKARGISAYDFSPKDGHLEYRGFGNAVNPSYVIADPERKIAYAVRECPDPDDPGVSAFRISRPAGGKIAFTPWGDGHLTGDHPCHVAFAGRTLVVSCYTSGSVTTFPLEDDGTIGPALQRIELTQHERTPHAHCAVFDAPRSRVYICDLGSDCLRTFDRSAAGLLTERPEMSLDFSYGDGPRHAVLHPDGDHLIVNCEHRGRVALVDLRGDRPREVANVPSLPERAVENASGAAVRIGGGGRHVYVSERNYSVITDLRVETDRQELRLRDTVPSGGERPRDILLSPDGQWLLAGNLTNHSIGVFRVGPGGGLRLNHVVRKVPSPTSLCWMPGV